MKAIDMYQPGELLRLVKYCAVGAMNTLITLAVIYVCKSLLEWNPYLSNALGYGCGLVNSFVCNRRWVFHSHGQYMGEILRFLLGFVACYALQLAAVYLLTKHYGHYTYTLAGIVLSGYGIATLIGNALYTMANYAYNRLITFTR